MEGSTCVVPLSLPLFPLSESPCHGQGGTMGTAMATARELCQHPGHRQHCQGRCPAWGGTEVGTMGWWQGLHEWWDAGSDL